MRVKRKTKYMLRRHILFLAVAISLSACAMERDTKPKAQEPAPQPVVKPAPQVDLLNAMDRPSVEVYPLSGPPVDPFTRKNLQPLSQKVLAEGYPVMDPSVSVYPLSPPTSMPNVAMTNVRTDAQSMLYTGKVRSTAMQNPPYKMQPITGEDMGSGMTVKTEALPPIPPPADSPSIWGDVPTAHLPPMPPVPFPVQEMAPVAQPIYQPPQPGRQSPPIDTSYGGSAATVTSGLPAPSSVNPTAVNAERPNTNAVMPSLTGY